MEGHRIEATLEHDGTFVIEGLPFQTGETVEVIILTKAPKREGIAYSLRGTPVKYADPFEAVAAGDWEAVR